MDQGNHEKHTHTSHGGTTANNADVVLTVSCTKHWIEKQTERKPNSLRDQTPYGGLMIRWSFHARGAPFGLLAPVVS
eukprot:6477729-Amphidinium_carterae.1